MCLCVCVCRDGVSGSATSESAVGSIVVDVYKDGVSGRASASSVGGASQSTYGFSTPLSRPWSESVRSVDEGREDCVGADADAGGRVTASNYTTLGDGVGKKLAAKKKRIL